MMVHEPVERLGIEQTLIGDVGGTQRRYANYERQRRQHACGVRQYAIQGSNTHPITSWKAARHWHRVACQNADAASPRGSILRRPHISPTTIRHEQNSRKAGSVTRFPDVTGGARAVDRVRTLKLP